MDILVECFGGLRVRAALDGDRLSTAEELPFLYNKSKALVAYLAVTGSVSTRSFLTNLLWSEMDERRALANLRVVLADLRKNMEDVVVTVGDSMWLAPDRVYSVDCRALSGTWGVMGSMDSDEESAARLRSTIDLYAGPFLESFSVEEAEVFDEWVAERRDYFHRRAVQALHTLTNRCLAHEDFETAVGLSYRLVALEPWDERARRRLMLALSGSGQPEAAIQEYHKLRDVLASESSSSPHPDTVALAESIAAGGKRRIGYRHASAIPAPPSTIFGRDSELDDIEQLLSASDTYTRLVTITGPGGVGKTRLGHAALIRLESTVRGGAAFVDLSGTESVPEVTTEIASALHVPLVGVREPLDELCAVLADAPVVLLLDNLEQLLPDVAGVVARIIDECPEVRIIATSRAPLAIRAERVYTLAPLPVPGAGDVMEKLATSPSVALFLDRARAAGRTLGLGQLESVADICRQLEGMPLAIELAASRTRHVTPDELRMSLWHELHVEDSRDGPDRHRSLAESIEWSYRLLDPATQRFVRYLSVFRGGAPWDVLESSLMKLIPASASTAAVDSSLVERRYVAGSSRFRLMEATRAFAGGMLVSEAEVDDATGRHVKGFVDFALRADLGLRGPDQLAWLRRIETELANLRAALEHSLDSSPQDALRLATAFGWYCNLRGHVREGIDWLERALHHAESASASIGGDDVWPGEIAAALNRLALLSVRLDEPEKLNAHARIENLARAEELALRAGNDMEAFESIHVRACRVQYEKDVDPGSIAASLEPLEGLLDKLQTSSDPRVIEMCGRFATCSASGRILMADVGGALEWARRARSYFERIGNRRGLGIATQQMGMATTLLGGRGSVLLHEAFGYLSDANDVMFLVFNLHALAGALFQEWSDDRDHDLDVAEHGARLLGAGNRSAADTGLHVPSGFAELLEGLAMAPRAALGGRVWELAWQDGWDAGLSVELPG